MLSCSRKVHECPRLKMSSFSKLAAVLCTLSFQLPEVFAARQSYDVRKIVDAFRHPHDDLTILCAHRGLK